MKRVLLGLVALVAVVWLLRLTRPARLNDAPPVATSAIGDATALRSRVLSREILSGLPAAAPGAIRGVVMDWNLGGGLATLVAIDDGSVSLYLNPTGGVIGAGTHVDVARAAADFRLAGERQRNSFHASVAYPVPGTDSVVFYLLTNSTTLTSGAIAATDVQQPLHPLFALGDAAQLLLTQVRLTR